MKTTNSFKLAMVAVGMLTIGTISAQTAPAVDILKTATAVKSIDNKGTIKYIQASNGITTHVNVTNEKTTTTFELGGVLTAPTLITADATNTFGIAGIKHVSAADIATGAAEFTPSTAATVGTTGVTLMIRDEATGEIKKVLAEDVAAYLQATVKNVYKEEILVADSAVDLAITVADLPVAATFKPGRLFVYKNGAKLRLGTDFSVNPLGGEITITSTSVPMYAADVFEIQYVY